MLFKIVSRFSSLTSQELIDLLLVGENSISVFTPNVDHIVRCCKDKELLDLYLGADILTNDSKVFSLLYFIFIGKNLPFLTGSDLTSSIFKNNNISRIRFGIIGCDATQISKLIDLYSLRNDIAHVSPSRGFIENKREVDCITLEVLKQNEVSLWFLAVGSPQQELLATVLRGKGVKGSLVCVGASLDYLTGKETRAPKFIQDMYLEWLFRFAQSPIKRFRRYFINCPQIIFYLLREKLLSK